MFGSIRLSVFQSAVSPPVIALILESFDLWPFPPLLATAKIRLRNPEGRDSQTNRLHVSSPHFFNFWSKKISMYNGNGLKL